uniref:Uncharacterized protein n=1 Tax=Chromera velia CCMP2878 TaxID=1169474 RepID=A0A0G4FAI6_9ALVE|eukprot:Cvel_15907.t1-p1 / transcript=Cvel_15907.t1 / gene=Cvel_15907 / organism=Chromera_velia_CCMP2878 / gene_product=GTP-binding protein yptV1, putative / transcript_product=GTP-binding protein yptV1, putative / location=Cvel_scaffold1202:30841-38162(-) / protein_length=677 / sequence_SO=supercontig / SO=protein_coding / is_pseudo=false
MAEDADKQGVRNLVLSVCDLKQHGDAPAGRVAAQIATVGTRLYLHGGADERQAYADLNMLQIETTSWKEQTTGGFSKPSARFGHSLNVWRDDKLVLFGGMASDSSGDIALDDQLSASFPAPPVMGSRAKPWAHQGAPSAEVYVLHVSKLQWERCEIEEGEGPTARGFHSACVAKDKLIVHGGVTDSNYTEISDELWVLPLDLLDSSSSSWSKTEQKGTLPGAKYGHKCEFVSASNQVLMFGGPNRDNKLYALDCDTMEWSTPEISHTPPMGRLFHSLSLVGDRLFVFAGLTFLETSDLYILELSKKKWSRPLYEGTVNVRGHSAAVLHDKLLVFGGSKERSGSSSKDKDKEGGGREDRGDALGDEGGSSHSQRISKKLFFLTCLEIRDGAGDGDYKFKLVTVGDSGVGKSCLLTRFTQDYYADFHVATIGVDFKTVITMVKGKLVKLQLWDTAGQERFGVVTGNYYRNADGFVFVFDATNRESLENIEESWMKQVEEHHELGPTTIKILIGNKADLKGELQVTDAEARAFADKIGASYVSTSAKTAQGVDSAFLSAATKLVDIRRKAAQSKTAGAGGAASSVSGGGAAASGSSGSGGGAGGGQGGGRGIRLGEDSGAARPAAAAGGCGAANCGGQMQQLQQRVQGSGGAQRGQQGGRGGGAEEEESRGLTGGGGGRR